MASLETAQLQGASLFGARLQGAFLGRAKLQGASLNGAELQGALLTSARLQGASLAGAQLQGASLNGAGLQGAWLLGAQLQGSLLQGAMLKATDLSRANLWRTHGNPGSFVDVRLPDDPDTWRPVIREDLEVRPWDDKAYHDLRKTIEALAPGDTRNYVLELIRALDCADKTLASCDPASPPAPSEWAKDALADEAPYRTALVPELRTLACSAFEDAVSVVRGRGFGSRLEGAGAEAVKLIDDLMNKDGQDCPVSAALTDADRAKLLRIKQRTAPAKD